MEPILIAVALVVVVLIMLMTVAGMYRKVAPNQALIKYGVGGTRIITGGATLVVPLVQSADTLSLELMSFDVAPQQDLYTKQGVAVTVEAVTQIKVHNDPLSIRTAAEQFLTKTPDAREALIRLMMEGHLRGIIGQLTVEQIVKEPEMVGDRMRATCTEDLSKMGLEIISFTIKEVRDQNEYIANMGKPDIARIRREANIAAAEADRDTQIRVSQTMRESSVARAEADQARVTAETQSLTVQAASQRDLELARAEYAGKVQSQKATADKAYEIQTNVMEQQLVVEKVRVDLVRKEEEIKVQDMEILRREKELIATVLKQAEVERQRIETIAQADKSRQILQATAQAETRRLQGQGEADARRLQGQAEAEVIRIQGLAEAEIIRAKGDSEADAMNKKAAAYLGYNQAAILDKLLTSLPETVRALAEPLTKVDKITIVSTGGGNGGGMGAEQVTGDITKMVAQVPALFEGLMGVRMQDLMTQIPALRAAMDDSHAPTNGKVATNGNGSGNGTLPTQTIINADGTRDK